MACTIERIRIPLEAQSVVIGKNSEAFTKGDPVFIDSNGYLARATAGTMIWGYVLETVTMASDNQTVAKLRPKVQPAFGVDVRIDTEAAGELVQSDVGEYADIVTSTTGATTISATPGTTAAQFMVKDFDPDRLGTAAGNAVAICVAAELQDMIGASQAI